VRSLLPTAVILELVVAASWLDLNAPVPPQVYSDERQSVAYLQGHRGEGRVLSIASDAYNPGDAATLQRIATATTGADSVYRTLVSTKFSEILTPNLSLAYNVDSIDGYDGGILPLANYVALKQVILPPCAICANPDAILREELAAPPPTRRAVLRLRRARRARLRDAQPRPCRRSNLGRPAGLRARARRDSACAP